MKPQIFAWTILRKMGVSKIHYDVRGIYAFYHKTYDYNQLIIKLLKIPQLGVVWGERGVSF
jgi:hypothetical protein